MNSLSHDHGLGGHMQAGHDGKSDMFIKHTHQAEGHKIGSKSKLRQNTTKAQTEPQSLG